MPTLNDNAGVLHRPSVVAGFMGLLFVAANLSSAIYPVFVSGMLASGAVRTDNIGTLATAEFLPFGLAVMFAGKFLAERGLRLVAAICLIVQCLACYATTRLEFNWLIACRALFGVASGVLLWIAYAYIAHSRHAGRLAGIYMTAQVVVGVFYSWIGPRWIMPSFGYVGVILLLAVPSLLALLLLPLSPNSFARDAAEPGPATNVQKHKVPAASFLVLVSIGAWSMSMTIFWVYSEPLAAHYDNGIVRYWLTTSLIFQIVGAASAAFLAERVSYRWATMVGLLVSVVQIVSILFGVTGVGFLFWSAVSGFVSNFLYAFYVEALIDTDPSRGSVVFFPAAQNLAGSIGPLLASQLVSGSDVTAGLVVDLIAIALAPLLLWIGIRMRVRQHIMVAQQTG